VSLTAFPSTILLLGLAFAARADDRGRLTSVRAAGDAESSAVELTGDRPLSFTTLQLQAPPRVVVDFADTDVAGIPAELSVEDGTVRRVATAAVGSGTARVVIELAADAEFDVRAIGNRIEVRVPRIAPLVARTSPPPAAPEAPDAGPAAAAQEKPVEAPPQVVAVNEADAGAPAEASAPPAAQVQAETAPQRATRPAQSEAAPTEAAPTEAEKRASLPTVSLVGSRPSGAAAEPPAPKPPSAAEEKRRHAQEKLAARKRAEEEAAQARQRQRAARLAAQAAARKLAAERAAAARLAADQHRAALAAEKRAAAEHRNALAAEKRAAEGHRAALAAEKRAAAQRAAAEEKERSRRAAEERVVAAREARIRSAAEKAAAQKKPRELAAAVQKHQKEAAPRPARPRPAEEPPMLTVGEAKALRAAAEQGLPGGPGAAPQPAQPTAAAPPKEVPAKEAHSRRVARAATDPSRIAISSIGFRPVGSGEVIIRSERQLTYGVSGEDRVILLHLPGSAIPRPNDRRPLDTHFFDGPVLRVVPVEVAGGVDLRIELRGRAEYQLSQSGPVITVAFSPAR
jgi:hypothetical protein